MSNKKGFTLFEICFAVVIISIFIIVLSIFKCPTKSMKGVVSRVTDSEVLIITEENKGACIKTEFIDDSIKPFLERGSVVDLQITLLGNVIVECSIERVIMSTALMNDKEIKIQMKNKYAEILTEIKDPQARILFEDALAKMLEKGKL